VRPEPWIPGGSEIVEREEDVAEVSSVSVEELREGRFECARSRPDQLAGE
jgi:hypothetical protein